MGVWRGEQTVCTVKSVSLTLGVLSDKARLLWRLRGIRSLGCACPRVVCCNVLHLCAHLEVPGQAVQSTPSRKYQGIKVALRGPMTGRTQRSASRVTGQTGTSSPNLRPVLRPCLCCAVHLRRRAGTKSLPCTVSSMSCHLPIQSRPISSRPSDARDQKLLQHLPGWRTTLTSTWTWTWDLDLDLCCCHLVEYLPWIWPRFLFISSRLVSIPTRRPFTYF